MMDGYLLLVLALFLFCSSSPVRENEVWFRWDGMGWNVC